MRESFSYMKMRWINSTEQDLYVLIHLSDRVCIHRWLNMILSNYRNEDICFVCKLDLQCFRTKNIERFSAEIGPLAHNSCVDMMPRCCSDHLQLKCRPLDIWTGHLLMQNTFLHIKKDTICWSNSAGQLPQHFCVYHWCEPSTAVPSYALTCTCHFSNNVHAGDDTIIICNAEISLVVGFPTTCCEVKVN